jgi:hypothetical protein
MFYLLTKNEVAQKAQRHEKFLYRGEIIDIYFVHKDFFNVPFFGYYQRYPALSDSFIIIRENLPSRVERFVKKHELYHLTDKNTWWGVLGQELRANIVPALSDPIGLFATIFATIASKERRKLYLDRFKHKY